MSLASNLTRKIPKNYAEMIDAMQKTEQTKGMSVYEHGQSVLTHVTELRDHLRGIYGLRDGYWRLPSWFSEFSSEIIKNLHEDGRFDSYVLHHDCGKPYCLVYDAKTGQRHFPDHAEVSAYIWGQINANYVVGHLIANDMVIHVATAEEIQRKLESEWSCEDSVTLLIAALAEIHANAVMFGGKESSSFKIKFKQVERRGRQILRHWFLNNQNG